MKTEAKPRKKRGRPPLPSDLRMSAREFVRLTPKQKEKLRELASSWNVTITEVIRLFVLAGIEREAA